MTKSAIPVVLLAVSSILSNPLPALADCLEMTYSVTKETYHTRKANDGKGTSPAGETGEKPGKTEKNAEGTTADSDSEAKTEAKTEAKSEAKTETKIETKHLEYRLQLGDNRLGVNEKTDQPVILDFQKRRVYKLSPSDKTYEDSSLYPVADFRAAESANRAALFKIMKKVGMAKKSGAKILSPFSSACELGMLPPELPASEDEEKGSEHGNQTDEKTEKENEGGKIVTTTNGDSITFSHDGTVFTEATLGEQLPEDSRRMYARFLTYRCALHPDVRTALAKTGRAIKHLSYTSQVGFDEEKVAMDLLSSKDSSETIAIPDDYKRVFDAESPLFQLQKKIIVPGKKVELPAKQAAVEQAKEMVDAGNYTDAFLTIMEYALTTGDQSIAETREIMTKAKDDETVQKIAKSLRPRSKEEAEKAMETLGTIDQKTLKKGYVLDIFRGNLAVSLGSDASKLFLLALDANPILTGAYNDLGEFYSRSYNTPLAWDCWDMVRYICPTHPFVDGIDQHQAFLERQCPDYF